MRVENNEVHWNSNTDGIKTVKPQNNTNIEIGKLLTSNTVKTTNDKTVKGTSATVVAQQQAESEMIGFNTQKLNITTAEGVTFTLDLHISKICFKDNTELTERLSKVLSNLPPKVLMDIKEECKHIVIPENIIYNKEAKGLALGPLNQIFLSADKLKELSNQEISETLVHELGHLVDYHSSSFGMSHGTKSYQREFSALKELISKDLGFDTEAHSFSGVKELFADYYLYNNFNVSDKHRSKQIFDLLTTYKNDVSTLSEEELKEKYDNKTNDVIELSNKWKALERQFKYYLGNVEDPEIVDRMNEDAKPMTFEQLDEKIEQQKNSLI